MTTYSIHPETRLGAVSLTVSDLERSLRFYTEVIGFKLLQQMQNTALLGSKENAPALVLTGQPDAAPLRRHTTGLYHFAILVPTRLDLARSLRQLAETRYPVQGASDHLVSEALYLADPDGNGIEIYVDRPRAEWPRRNGQLLMATDPLDLDGLMRELEQDDTAWAGLPEQTQIGHVHLHVADLDEAENFYGNVLGFDIMFRYGPSALFVSAGGYHHHLGLNTWAGRGAPPPSANTVGLRHFTVILPDEAERSRLLAHLRDSGISFSEAGDVITLRDPSHNGIQLLVASQQQAPAKALSLENAR
ncbi:MAG: VOC family protein [Anaerolineales bacterium]|nr:VOC family protein [Anaerolineales bacterium]